MLHVVRRSKNDREPKTFTTLCRRLRAVVLGILLPIELGRKKILEPAAATRIMKRTRGVAYYIAPGGWRHGWDSF